MSYLLKHKRYLFSPALLSAVPVLIFIVLAFFQLGSTSLWLDEIMSMDFSDGSINETISSLREDVHAPFYFSVLHVFLKIMGISELAGRLPGVIAAAGTVIALFFLARELTTTRAAFVSCLVLAISPFFIEYSREIRPYAMSSLLTTLTWLFFIRLVRRGKTVDTILYGLTSGMLLLTFYMGLAILLSQFILFWFLRIAHRKRTRILLSWALGAAVFAPWIPSVFYQFSHNRIHVITRYFPEGISSRNVVSALTEMILGAGSVFSNIFISIIILLVFLGAGIAIIISARRQTRLQRTRTRLERLIVWIFWGGVSLYVGLCLIRPVFVARYFMMFIPLAALYLGIAISRLPRFSQYTIIIILVAWSLFSYRIYLESLPREDWRGISEFLVQYMQPQDLIVCHNINAVSCLIYYFKMMGRKELNHKTFPFDLYYEKTRGRFPYPDRTLWFVRTNPARQNDQLSLLRQENIQQGNFGFKKSFALYTFRGKNK